MITLNCFENFKCINKHCTDSCCIGWDIYIDKDTESCFRALEGDFGDRIRKNITKTSPAKFITDEKGRCPFLNSDGLCDIILTIGEDKIPYICKNHPRFYNGDEMGIGIACEEGARLLLTSPDAYITGLKEDTVIKKIRGKAIEIIKEKGVPFYKRLIGFLDFACEADDLFIFDDEEGLLSLINCYEMSEFTNEKENYTKEYIDFLKKLESVGEVWDEFLNTLDSNYSDFKAFEYLKNADFKKYENLAVYYIFRYFIKCEADGDIISKAKLTVINIIMHIIMDVCSFSVMGEENTLKNSVLYSRELEYSEENIELLYEQSEENELFTYEELVKFINYLGEL